MAILKIRNVTRRYAELSAVDDVSFSVEAGFFHFAQALRLWQDHLAQDDCRL